MYMIKNFTTIAFRNLFKNKIFSFINIAGLALGLAVFILIMLWVQNEKSYNGFHTDGERIAAVMINQAHSNKEVATFPAVPSLLANALVKDFPSIQYATTTSWGDNRQFTVDDKSFIEYGLYASPEFLNVFTFPLIKGKSDHLLRDPNTILITEKLALKYFGNEDPIGKIIQIDQHTPYKVEGILKDVPANATLTFDFLMPISDYISAYMPTGENWGVNNMRTYIKWRADADPDQLGAGLRKYLTAYSDKQANSELILWNLKDWYLRYDFKDGKYAGGGRIVYVRLFTVIAFLILFLACINFMNLSTARATQRSKEVGVRKTIGAGRISLVYQFLGESMLYVVLAGILALGFVYTVLPVLNDFLRRKIEIDYYDYTNGFYFLAILIVTGLLAGSYPSFVLSSFRPIKVLKNNLAPTLSNTVSIRKSLVILQFMVSISLIIGTVIISKQINFIKNRELGYNKEHLIWFPNNIAQDKINFGLQEIKKIPGVSQAALASLTFTMANNRGSEVSWPGKNDVQDIFFNFLAASHDITKTMGLTLVDGRGFSNSFVTDTGTYLLNEEAVRRMGLKNPVGQTLESNGYKGKIVGVVKDFHFESLYNPIGPMIIMCRPEWTWNIYVRMDGKDIPTTLKELEKVYKSLAPGFILDYNFQDKEYERLYRSDAQVGTLVKWFAFFALFISFLGLLGLTIFTVELKTKEIGIRKVLGASIASILSLISKEFIALVGIAAMLAMLPSYYYMNKWLNNFAYRSVLDWKIFGGVGVCVVLFALITVTIISFKQVKMNPVKSLKTE